MKRIVLPLMLMSCVATACYNNEIDESKIVYDRKIAVEGSIESGDFARVTLTYSLPMTDSMDTLMLLNHVIKHAKVTVSNGEQREVLALHTNSHKIPPYEYRSNEIVGEAGKSYTLNIAVDNRVITAETYIPERVPLEDLRFEKADNDTTGYIHIKFRNTTNSYYLVSTKVTGKDHVFFPCLYGSIDKDLYEYGETVSMQINKSPVIFPESDFETFFTTPNLVKVKFSTHTKASHEFWTSYQNELINSQNPIFPAFSNLKSNINGGIGIWSGYGSFVYEIDL